MEMNIRFVYEAVFGVYLLFQMEVPRLSFKAILIPLVIFLSLTIGRLLLGIPEWYGNELLKALESLSMLIFMTSFLAWVANKTKLDIRIASVPFVASLILIDIARIKLKI